MPRPIATTPAERIATIIEAAERAAAAVVDNAEANAKAYLEEAQAEADRIVAARLASLSELTDALVAQAEAARRQSERLLDSFDGAGTQLDLPTEPSPEPAEAPGPDSAGDLSDLVESEEDAGLSGGFRLSAVESPPPFEPPAEVQPLTPEPVPIPEHQPEPQPEPAPEPPRGEPASSAGARLLATQMAVSGSSREEIDRRLRSGFEIEDTAPILDAILGTEG
jgi:vacuolar-type H+-ATPase subunit H